MNDRNFMTVMSEFKTNTTNTAKTTEVAYAGGHVVRAVSGALCPHCLQQLHASAVRDIGEDEFAWTCQGCHHDVLTIRTY